MAILILEILNIVLPVFLVIGLGYGVKRSTLVDDNFLFQLNKLVYYLALPLMLFYTIATADFTASFNGSLVAGLAIITVLGFLGSYGYAALTGYSPAVRGTFSQCSFRGNIVYVGLAIVFNAYGDGGLASAGIVLGFIVPVFNFFSIVALLLPHQGSRVQPSVLLHQIAYNPLILASFVGIIWSFINLPIPSILEKALQIIAGMALPLALLSIGASFSLSKLKGDLKPAFIATGLKLVIMPLFAAALFVLLGVGGQDLAIGVIFAGAPTATAAYIFTQQMKGDAELSRAIIMLTTLFSIISFTLILLLLRSIGL